MDISKAKQGFFTVKIDIGQFLGVEEKAEFVCMREFTRTEQQEIEAMGIRELFRRVENVTPENEGELRIELSRYDKYLDNKLPELITDHSFTDGEAKADKNLVASLIIERPTCRAYIWRQLTEKNPYQPKPSEKSTR